MTTSSKLGAALLCSAAVLALSQPAAAQSQTDATTGDAANEDSGVGVIVVTAQRREENLQDVPLSVAAIGREEIREKDITDVSRLEQLVPGLRLNRTGSAQRPAIRGVYTEAIGLNSDPRIGFYIDEIYQARPQQATAALVDLQRIEVQKGPQGTLFGRNSYGGNIALTTALPVDYIEGGVDLTIGNYDRIRTEAFVNLPVSPDLAFRFAGAIERRDGFLESVVRDEADLQDKHEDYVRGTLRWTPASLDNRLELILRGSYFHRGGAGFNAVNGKVIGVAVDPSLITAPGGTINFNGQAYTFPLAGNGTGGFNGLNLGTGTLFPFSNALRDGIADVNGADVGIPVPGPYANIYDAAPFEDLDQQQYSAVINFDVSDTVRLRSISSFTDFDSLAGGDGDGTPLPLQYFVAGTRSDVFTQEFQVQSTDSSSPFQYTIGAFYLNEDGRDGTSFYYLNRNYTTANAASLGLPTYFGAGGGIGGSSNACQFSFTTPNACALNFTTGNLFDFRTVNEAKTESYAVYAQGSYDLTDQLTLTLGGRYTVDDKEYKTILQSPANGTLFAGQYATQQGLPGSNAYYAVNPFFNYDFNEMCGGFTPQGISTDRSDQTVATVPNYFFTICEQEKFDFFTFRGAVDYDITPDNLVYASFSTGAHSGGFGAGVTAANNPGFITTFDTEKVEAFELGSKNRFFDGRLQLNLAAFYNRFTDLQEQGTQIVTIDGQNRNITTIFNVGGQDTPGFEIDAIANPVPGFTLTASVVYLRARYDKFERYAPPNFICFYISQPSCGSGAFPPTAPQNFGVGGGYFPNAQTNPDLFIQTGIPGFDFAFVPTDRRVQNTPDWSGVFGASYEIPVGESATLTPEFDVLYSGDYLLSASAPNVVQEDYAKIDARLTFRHDSGLSVQAFVQNLTDKATLGRITTGTLSAQGTYGDPRTYGVRVGYRF